MPIHIGQTDHSFDNPLGLLSDCHRRIEMFLGSLQAVAAISASPLSDESRRALTAALRYFREAAPKHTADEEQSLFPRLRQAGDARVRGALAQIEALEADHRRADELHAQAGQLGAQLLADGSLPPQSADRFQNVTSELAELYAHHINLEDRGIFPLSREVLSPSEQAHIAEEMAERRSLKR